MTQNGARLEALRDAIFVALARGDEASARRGIEKLRPHAPAEAAGLLTALHIEAGRAQEALAAWAECERCAPHDPYTVFLRARIALLDGERHAALDLLLPLMDAPLSPAIARRSITSRGNVRVSSGARGRRSPFTRGRAMLPPTLRSRRSTRAMCSSTVTIFPRLLPRTGRRRRNTARSLRLCGNSITRDTGEARGCGSAIFLLM